VGATFYRAITGQVPPEALDRAVNDDIVPPRRLGIDMSSAEESALMRSLAVRPADRFQNVAAFQSALARVPPPISDRQPCPACRTLNAPQAPACSTCGAALRRTLEPGRLQFAGFGRRAAAFLIDCFVTTIAAWLMFLVLVAASTQTRTFGSIGTGSPLAFFQGYYPSYQARHNDDTITVVAIVTLMMMWFVTWLYSSLMESSARQGTLGKIITGLAVTDLKGERISFLRAASRYLLKTGLSLCGAGYLAAAITENRQAVHDLIAGTVVIVKPRP